MPLPFSGNQLKKLGARLASPEPIAEADYAMFAQVAAAYQAVLDSVEQRLQDLGYQATTRVKTTGTLIDKLRRTPGLQLNSIHDLAGARIVIDGGRWEQDQICHRIVNAFADGTKPADRIDRLVNPSHGYRAVHIVVFPDGVPVEIQVRTILQDSWAQITEKLGDAWGRGLRYGFGPDQPDAPMSPGNSATRGDVMIQTAELSESIAKFEEVEYALAGAKARTHDMMRRLIVDLGALGGG